MLVGTDNRAIDIVRVPIELSGGIGLLLDGGQEVIPQASPTPAIESAGDRAPGAIPLRQITPGCPRAEDPQDTIKDAAMVHCRTAGLRLLEWEQRLQPLPWRMREVMSVHRDKDTS